MLFDLYLSEMSGKDETLESKIIFRAVIGFILYTILPPALLFLAAGTLRWPMAWGYIILIIFAMVISRLLVLRKNPDLLLERARFSQRDQSSVQDRLLVAVIAVYGPMAAAILAGLDQRFGWPAWASPLIVAAPTTACHAVSSAWS
jgi:hypothetical protein